MLSLTFVENRFVQFPGHWCIPTRSFCDSVQWQCSNMFCPEGIHLVFSNSVPSTGLHPRSCFTHPWARDELSFDPKRMRWTQFMVESLLNHGSRRLSCTTISITSTRTWILNLNLKYELYLRWIVDTWDAHQEYETIKHTFTSIRATLEMFYATLA